MFGAFSEENQKAIQDCTKDVDAEDLLIQELQLLTAREAFLLQRITAAQEKIYTKCTKGVANKRLAP